MENWHEEIYIDPYLFFFFFFLSRKHRHTTGQKAEKSSEQHREKKKRLVPAREEVRLGYPNTATHWHNFSGNSSRF